VLDEDVEGFHHAGADPCRDELVARPAIAVPAPGKFFSCASLGFSCVPTAASGPTITSVDHH